MQKKLSALWLDQKTDSFLNTLSALLQAIYFQLLIIFKHLFSR